MSINNFLHEDLQDEIKKPVKVLNRLSYQRLPFLKVFLVDIHLIRILKQDSFNIQNYQLYALFWGYTSLIFYLSSGSQCTLCTCVLYVWLKVYIISKMASSQWESDVLWTSKDVYMKSGLHIDVHWTSKGRLMSTGFPCTQNFFINILFYFLLKFCVRL